MIHPLEELASRVARRLALRCETARQGAAQPRRAPHRRGGRAIARRAAIVGALLVLGVRWAAAEPVQFARDIKPILSNKCYFCHGPDAAQRKGGANGLRLDEAAGATADLGGYAAVVPGDPDHSALVSRICSSDADELMPPPATGKKLAPREIELLRQWIREGAVYTSHWSYAKPGRPPAPAVEDDAWPRSDIDRFVLARLEHEGLAPAAEADRETLVRRLSLDLVGLPPTLDEVDRFVNDADPAAYERLVDRLLASPAFGERWAQAWLDLARYADSAGYADDPPRTIWAYRDYVIRAFNANKPFDRFTIEQLAGDLLPGATEEQLIATAFHRNTPTNNEGGTDDEEFRNVAIVDRVNTTAAVWLGTTVACAQCHHHKYDPISQAEYFRLFALFNSTQDADRRDESPTLSFYQPEEQQERERLLAEQGALRQTLATATPELSTAAERWARGVVSGVEWRPLALSWPSPEAGSGDALPLDVFAAQRQAEGGAADRKPAREPEMQTLELEFPAPQAQLRALRVEILPDASAAARQANLQIARLTAAVTTSARRAVEARFVRVELPGNKRMLSLAEVEVFSGGQNVARAGAATQSSTDFDGPASRAIDGNTDGDYFAASSTTHTRETKDPWWEVDLKSPQPIEHIVLWNRTDADLQSRLNGCRVMALDANRRPVWEQSLAEAPRREASLDTGSRRMIEFVSVAADFAADLTPPARTVKNADPVPRGWRVAGSAGQPHALALATKAPVEIAAGERLSIALTFMRDPKPAAGETQDPAPLWFRFSVSESPRALDSARLPADLQEAVRLSLEPSPAASAAGPGSPRRSLTAPEVDRLTRVYLAVAPELAAARSQLAKVDSRLNELKPNTVPIMRELAADKRRKTRIQRRGNFLDLGDEVTPGAPSVFPPLPEGAPVDRLALARWLVADDHPLTARVTANRFWEQLFGVGIVATSEEFGSQGDLPSHPELLDWLARALVESGWDVKAFLKQIVLSSVYRQSSRVSAELAARDPDNRLLARGPRVRLSAEMVRDQALAVSGLLSLKMHGPPVRPPQPALGLTAAFGGATDWQTSVGEDRYRRAIYTTWRRSNPYPSMTTFDAPNREVCAVRRSRTNTPLQALVTLNDPVFVEAAQSLGRRMAAASDSTDERLRHGFRLCLARWPSDAEMARLTRLYNTTLQRFDSHSEDATKLATDPIGPLPPGAKANELAALVVVGNVLLNLDELLFKR